MQKRKLGESGLSIAPIMLGGNVFGWTADEPTSFRILDAFVAAGFDAIDTADVYSIFIPGNKGGESETVIGNWLANRKKRDDVVIATKLGAPMAPDKQGLKPAYMKRAVEDSLRRLQTDYIDLYQAHRDDTDTPLEDTLSTFAELIREGKVRAIGASNYNAARLEEALAISARLGIPAYTTLQPHYNLYDRAGYEAELDGVCRKHGVGVIPYFALASGFLTGKYRSEADFGKSPRGRRMASFLNDRGKRILGALDEVAAANRATPAQVALAWLLAKPAVAAPIASATSLEQLADILRAADLAVTAKDVEALDTASKA